MFSVNFLRNFLRRTPVVASDLLLVAPFTEHQRLAEALVKDAVGETATFTGTDAEGLVGIPLDKYRKKGGVPLLYSKKDGVPLLYSLRGFLEHDADDSRALLGLSTHQTRRLEHAFMDRLRLSTTVCVVCLDLTVTPLPYEALAEDLPFLRKTFGRRLIFVGLNGEKLRSWNLESRHTRIQKWRTLVQPTEEFIECSLDATGLAELLQAVSKAWTAGAAQRTQNIPKHT